MKKTLCTIPLLLLIIFSSLAQTDWQPLPYIFSSSISDFQVFDNKLMIGGNFTNINNSSGLFSAIYDGSTMSGNSQTIGGTGFESFTIHKGNLVGGGGSTVGTSNWGPRMVIEWDGSEWGNSDYSLNGSVDQVISYNDTLFTSTTFTTSVVGFDYAAYFDGSDWIQAGSPLNSPPSYIVFNNTLFAYGNFTTSGTETVKYFAKWKNGNWVQAGTGSRKPVFPVVYKNKLFAFESISKDGWESTLQLLEWSGSDWTAHSNQTIVTDANNLRAITADQNNIYIAGDLLKAGNKTVFNSARFDGNNWYAMGDALDSVLVNTLEVYNGNLYAGTSWSFKTYDAYMYKFPLAQVATVTDPEYSEQSFFYNFQHKQVVFSENEGGEFSITSSLGAEVMNGKITGEQTVDLQFLEKGVYIVRYSTKYGIESKKILVN